MTKARWGLGWQASLALAAAGLSLGCGGGDAGGAAGSGGSSSGGQPGAGGAGAASSGLTWYRDVLPLVQRECLGCHTDGGIGPFSMENYQDAFVNASAMAIETRTGRMPPWMPADDCGSFRDRRGLTPEEVEVFGAWLEAGAPEGDPADAPPEPEAPATLAWVDRELDIGTDYVPAPPLAGTDDYHCFVMDPQLTEQEDLIGFQVHPATDQVHHVLVYQVDLSTALQRDAQDDEPGWECFGGPGVDGSMIGGWVPGSPPTRLPEGVGIGLKAGSALVAQFHFNTQGRPPVADRSSLDLQYATEPVARPGQFLSLADARFEIPPHSPSHTTSVTMEAPATGRIWGIAPHMHQLGQRITVELERAGGSECLVDIPAWDFNWQQFYFYDAAEGIPAQKGEQIRLSCTFENPTDRSVRWGESTTDEMCIVYFLAGP